jgi:hypothetical protein
MEDRIKFGTKGHARVKQANSKMQYPWQMVTNNHTVKLLYDYFMSKEYEKDFENSETSDLNKLLKEFDFNIRRING